MQELIFNFNQCVEIMNLQQFKSVYHQLNSKYKFEEFIEKYGKLDFPLYFFKHPYYDYKGKAIIGITYSPVNIWTNQFFQILPYNAYLIFLN